MIINFNTMWEKLKELNAYEEQKKLLLYTIDLYMPHISKNLFQHIKIHKAFKIAYKLLKSGKVDNDIVNSKLIKKYSKIFNSDWWNQIYLEIGAAGYDLWGKVKEGIYTVNGKQGKHPDYYYNMLLSTIGEIIAQRGSDISDKQDWTNKQKIKKYGLKLIDKCEKDLVEYQTKSVWYKIDKQGVYGFGWE